MEFVEMGRVCGREDGVLGDEGEGEGFAGEVFGGRDR